MSRMKNLEVIAVEVPLSTVFSGSKYQVTKRCTIVTRIETDDGLVSEIYNGDNRKDGKQIVTMMTEEFWPRIKGEDIFKSQAIWEKMFPVVPAYPPHKMGVEALACLDTAIWDLRGKATGKSVSALLGGCYDELPMMGIGGYYGEGKNLSDVEKEVDWIYNTVGIHATKLKIGGLSPEEDARRIEAARRAAPKMIIAVDANRGWDHVQAVRFARLAEQYDIRWFEEPFYWFDDAYGMARIRNKINIPIAAGQTEMTGNGIRRLLEARAVDVVNFDASKACGITDWQRVSALCKLYGIQMTHHEEPQIAMQLLASVPHGSFVENFPDPNRDPVWDKMVVNKPPIVNGKIRIPTEDGFGIKLDWDFVKKYRIN